MRHVKIYIDSREDKKSVDQYVEEMAEDIAIVKSQITTGDYAIEVNGQIRMIIERKTWKDLVASIRDKRIDGQVEHMMQARETLGTCSLLMLIEGGQVFPDPNKCIAKMPAKNLLAKLRHLLVRDNIPWVHSKSPGHSAEIIVDFAKDIGSLYPPADGEPVVGGDEILYKKHDNTLRELIDMWSVLPGIGRTSARTYAQFSFAEVISGEVDDKLATLKTVSGRPLNGMAAKNALMDPTIAAKVLAQISGVTSTSADKLLAEATLAELASNDDAIHERVAQASLNDKRRIGPAMVKKVHAALTRKIDQ